ncbi:hypothetical protein [Dyadobacter sp. OTU695]|uniref:hypothetical protein n=1 Tax=Dyadobacter sp. OTU695 TaxID=3043860 RepID=UPI00313E6BEA
MSDRGGTRVLDASNLLGKGTGQADLVHQHFTKLVSKEGHQCAQGEKFCVRIQSFASERSEAGRLRVTVPVYTLV